MNKTLQYYVRLKKKQPKNINNLLPRLEQGGLSKKAKRIADDRYVELWNEIRGFQPTEGWLCFQSSVESFKGGKLPEPKAQRGWILTGEMINAEGKSLHIQQHPESGWVITKSTEQTEGDYLVQSCAFLSTEDRLGKLKYQVYWEHDPEHGYQRRFSRFAGFEKKGGEDG